MVPRCPQDELEKVMRLVGAPTIDRLNHRLVDATSLTKHTDCAPIPSSVRTRERERPLPPFPRTHLTARLCSRLFIGLSHVCRPCVFSRTCTKPRPSLSGAQPSRTRCRPGGVRDSNSGRRLLLPPANCCRIFASRTTRRDGLTKKIEELQAQLASLDKGSGGTSSTSSRHP